MSNVQDKVAVDRRLVSVVRRAVTVCLELERRRPAGFEVSVALVDDRKIRELNQRYRGVDHATDVLAFPLQDGGPPSRAGRQTLLGDVVVSLETAQRQAAERHHRLPLELAHLVAHGVLHLLGYNDGDEASAAQMGSKQAQVLERLGIEW